MASSKAKANHISNLRAAYERILEADEALQALVNEASDNGYVFVDGDFTNDNAGITASDYNAALTQATNWTNALKLGIGVGGGAAATLPAGLRGVFSKVAK
jgi:hypothetical protein